jgi:GNAT superfamily N-acetyltransferase
MNYRSSGTTVHQAAPEDLDAVTHVLVEAFLHGDLAAWLIPDPDTRHRIYRPYFAMLAEHAIDHAHVELAGDAGAVALWHTVAGGQFPVIPDYDDRLTAITGRYASRFAQLDHAMHEHHPREWHHHLAFLAVHPDRQRHGLGSALLHHHHAALDEAGTPASLEATGARNVRLYVRHGYRPRRTYRIAAGGPRLYPMWRAPA